MKKSCLIISWMVLNVAIISCRDYHDEIKFIDDTEKSYQYAINQNGILKLVHHPNQLILYDCDLRKVDIIENFGQMLNYNFVNWTNDTLEISFSIYKTDWNYYKSWYYDLCNKETTIGKYKIKYRYRLYTPESAGISKPDSVDLIKVNSKCTEIQLYYQGRFIENVEINNLEFSNGYLYFYLSKDENVVTREIVLTDGLTRHDILEKIIAKYKTMYCK